MATERRESVFRIRLENGPALKQFERNRKAISDNAFALRENNKAIKQNIQAEKELRAEIALEGKATEAQGRALVNLIKERKRLEASASENEIALKGLRGENRELGNDLSLLTERGLRFRDKMAGATLEALKQSGVIGQLVNKNQFLKDSLDEVNSRLDKSGKEMSELEAAYAKGIISEKKYAEEKERLNKEINVQTKEAKKLERELSDVEDETTRLERKVEKLNEEWRQGRKSTEEYKKALKDINTNTSNLSSKFDSFVAGQGSRLKGALGGIATSWIGVGAAIYGVVQAFDAALDVIVEFDAGLARVKALGEDYEDSIDSLGDKAIELGAKYGIGASQALEGVEELAKAGLSAQDIISGGLDGALALAAASNISVGEAAEFAADSMTQFNLTGSDIPHLADLIAAGADKATGGVEDLREAFANGGLSLGQFNVTTEESAGVLTLFAANALKGSRAGTQIRRILTRLADPSREAKDELEKLGIAAFDTEGKFVGFENLAGQLQDRLSGLTDEQRQTSLSIIFGQQALDGANILYKSGADGVRDYTEAVDDAGFANEVAEKRLDSITGAQQKAKAAWEQFVLSIERGDGVIGNAVRGALEVFTDLFDMLTRINKISGERAEVEERVREQIALLTDDINIQNAAIGDYVKNLDASFGMLNGLREGEGRLLILQDERAAALSKINDLEGAVSSRRIVELAVEKARLAEIDRLITEEETKRLAAAAATEEQTDALEDNTDGLEENSGALGENNEKTKELSDSERARIALLREMTAEADKLSKINPIDILAGQRNQGPTNDDELNRLIEEKRRRDEAIAAAAKHAKAIEDYNLQQLQSSDNLYDQLAALEMEWANGSIDTYQEYLDRRDEINEQIKESDRQVIEAQLASAAGLFEVLQQFSDYGFDRQLADIDSELVALKESQDATNDPAQIERIEATIKAREKEKAALEKAKETQKNFAIAAALINTYLGASYALRDPTIPSTLVRILTVAKVIATGLLSVAKLRGFVGGGDVDGKTGDVRSSWGQSYQFPSGDNVLVRTMSGPVALKTGEKVLNKSQQRRAERIAGPGLWGAIGLPGYKRPESWVNMGTNRVPAYTVGGSLSVDETRPTPAAVVNNQIAGAVQRSSDRSQFVSWTEFSELDSSIELREELGSLGSDD